ncbi:MAG: prepilin-type N-terminal cleavage/methylation domain-containing protein [Candidatus Paceibacterota bacterium]
MNMKKGFTLIEALVAVTILTLAVSGPLMAASRAIVAAETSRDQLIASYLAQEGIEYIRAMRDDEYLKLYTSGDTTGAWANFLAAISKCVGTACSFDRAGPSLSSCSGAACTPLYLSSGIYTQQSTSGTKTVFTRTLQATSISANEERIVSTVTWSFHDALYTVTVTDHLTPWQ